MTTLLKINFFVTFSKFIYFFRYFLLFSSFFLFLFLTHYDLNSEILTVLYFWFFSNISLFFFIFDYLPEFNLNFSSLDESLFNNTSFFFLNPQSDLDSSSSTDSDDLVVFIADIFEFSEHEQSLLVDSLTDTLGVSILYGLGTISAALSIRSFKK